MKNMKKFSAIVLAIVMVLMYAVPMSVFAADPQEGDAKTITITSPSDLSDTDTTTYYIYKVFNATSDGTSDNINYTKLTDKSLPVTATDGLSKFDADSAGNIHYYTKATISDENWTLVDDASSLELSDAMISAIGTYVSGDTYVATTTITGPSAKSTVLLDDYGYYYITTTTGSVVTIDSTAPSASVNDKNSVPSVDKSITGISNEGTIEDGEGTGNESEVGKAKIGDVVTYSVTVHAKKGAVNYIFHDKLSAGLSLEAQSNLSIKVNGSEIGASNYSVQYWNDTDATNQTDTEAGDNITIRFDNVYLKSLTASNDADIVVSYKAKINDNAVIASTGNPNTVDLEYGQDPTATNDTDKKEPTKKTEEDEATVYTYALALKKVNESGEALDGATFQFPFYVKEEADTDGAYIYAGTTAGEGLVNTLTTPTNGEITIKGVQDVAYTITETVAPKGYNKLTADITITPEVTSAETTTTSKTIYLDADGNVVSEEVAEGGHTVTYENSNMAVGGFQVVVNKGGSELPSTGGIGTTIFYILGSILVLGAGVLLVTRRRMRSSEE